MTNIKEFIIKKENSILLSIILLSFILSICISYINMTNHSILEDYEKIISDIEKKEYIRFVYIGSSECAFSNNPLTHDLILDVKNTLQKYSNHIESGFLSSGIAIDLNVKKGLEFLSKTGPYSEIVSGLDWYNLGSSKYIYGDMPGKPVIPQVILSTTSYDPVLYGRVNIHREDRVLKRYTGLTEIRELHEYLKAAPLSEIENLLDL